MAYLTVGSFAIDVLYMEITLSKSGLEFDYAGPLIENAHCDFWLINLGWFKNHKIKIYGIKVEYSCVKMLFSF